MRSFLISVLGFLTSWWGLWLLAALDSSMVFFLPFCVDIAVIVLASRSPTMFWLYPILATGGTLCGAAVTFYIGRRLGEAGLEHFVSKKRLIGWRRRIENKGAVALAALNVIPPPFPFTACVLAAGALKVNTAVFFVTLGLTRLLRFGAEAILARFYGRRIIAWLESQTVAYVGIGLFAAALVGTTITIVQLIHKTRAHRSSGNKRAL
jgi:membrane protein YqaA with SNARE-associated domain